MVSRVLTKFLAYLDAMPDQSADFSIPYEGAPALLSAQLAVDVLRHMSGDSLYVVGGDIWIVGGSLSEIVEDWFYKKIQDMENCNMANASISIALRHVENAIVEYGQKAFVDLVVVDAETSESGRDAIARLIRNKLKK